MRVMIKELWNNTFRVNLWDAKPMLEDSTVPVEQIIGSYFIKTDNKGAITESRPTATEDHHKVIENKIKASLATKDAKPIKAVHKEEECEPACV